MLNMPHHRLGPMPGVVAESPVTLPPGTANFARSRNAGLMCWQAIVAGAIRARNAPLCVCLFACAAGSRLWQAPRAPAIPAPNLRRLAQDTSGAFLIAQNSRSLESAVHNHR